MRDPVKIWTRINDAFTTLEVEDIAVKTITLPLQWFRIIVKGPTVLSRFQGYYDNMLCCVISPCCKRCRRISGARVKFGSRLKVA
jgi:hypothetical protein